MKHIIGIDLGGSKMASGVVNTEGLVLRTVTEPTASFGREQLIEQLVGVVKLLSEDMNVVAIGVGTPGFVDSQQGLVLLATNLLGWTGVYLKRELEERLRGLPVVVENDANVAALGEAWLGAGRDIESFLMLTLGTGVGGAIYSKHTELWRGANYRAGEFGHAILYPDGLPCGCGRRGCVEQYLSGRSLARAYSEQSGNPSTAERVFALANQGDTVALGVVQGFVRDLAVLLTSLQNMLDPTAFVLSGGLVSSREAWWQSLEQQLGSSGGESVRILPAHLGNNAGVLGAAWLALRATQ